MQSLRHAMSRIHPRVQQLDVSWTIWFVTRQEIITKRVRGANFPVVAGAAGAEFRRAENSHMTALQVT